MQNAKILLEIKLLAGMSTCFQSNNTKTKKHERLKQTTGKKQVTKVARKRTRDEYAVSFSILKSLTELCGVVLQHQVVTHVIVFKVSVSRQKFS